MNSPFEIIYEDNHIIVVNKAAGMLVQSDRLESVSIEELLKSFLKKRDNKEGNVFLGVVHRIDRPVSGAVMFAKTSKALVRLNEMIKNREIEKQYLAIVERPLIEQKGELRHYISRNQKSNKSTAHDNEVKESKLAILKYAFILSSEKYYLLKVELVTGRHHQIRAQLTKMGSPIKGDLKYGARRSNEDGSISLHSREISFLHPVSKEAVRVIAPVPKDDNLWAFFEKNLPK